MADIIRKHPETGELFHPHRFRDGLYRVADPALGSKKHHAENQIPTTEQEIAGYVRRGFHLRMRGELTGQVNLVRPEEIEIIGDGLAAAPMAFREPPKVRPASAPPAPVSAPLPLAISHGATLPPHGRISCAACFPDRRAQWGETMLERADGG